MRDPAQTPIPAQTAGDRPGARHTAILGPSQSYSWMRTAAEICLPLLLIGVLAWPMLFTNAAFNEDWVNHLWYLWHQSIAIRENHLPSLFLNYSEGLFYPFYAFYGGTLYALAGTLSLILGDAPLGTYVLTYMIGFAAAYGGWYWLARTFGLSGWLAHVPGLIFITSGPYLTMIYGLGDWPEFLAVSAMPPLIASGLWVLRAPRLSIWPAFALIASSVIFFGSHLLTAVWGTTVLALMALALLAFVPDTRHYISRRGILRLLGLMVPAALVSAWFILPAFAYESQTVIANSYPHFRGVLRSTMFIVAAKHLFTLSHQGASGTIVTSALPVLCIAWTLASIAISLFMRRRDSWLRALLVGTGATAMLVVLMTHANLILHLPRLYSILQFSFRLESYVLLGVSGTLLIALVQVGRGGGKLARWRWLLAPIAVVSLIGAVEQVGSYPSQGNRNTLVASFTKPTFEREGLLDYVDDSVPILRAHLPKVSFPPSAAPDGRVSAVVKMGSGSRLDSNIRSTPDLIHIDGARVIGTDAHANDVLELDRATARPRPGGPGRSSTRSVRLTVSPASSLPVVLGRWLSLAALLTLAAELGVLAVRRYRDGRTKVRPT